MADNRLKGQDVVVRITRQGRLEAQITAVKDFAINVDAASIQEGYLGEPEDRFDDIVNGCSGSITVAHEGPEVLRLVQFIIDRAQRKIVGDDAKINVTARFNFPDGRRPRVMVRDLKFDQIPIGASGRAEYVNTTFSFKAPTPKILES